MHSRCAIVSLLIAALQFASVAQAEPAAGGAIADFRLPDHLGQEHVLSEFANRELVVVAFLGTQCPLAKLYAGRLQVLANEYAERGVAVVAVMSNAQDSLADIAAYVRQHNITFPVLKDRRNEVAEMLGAERTPQVFLLDRQRTVRYQGRVDDQYLVGIVRDKPTREDLRAAIDELLGGKLVSVPQTDVIGCIIGRAHEPKPDSEVTYARDIAPIFQAHCVECHRTGQIGPFELSSYEEAAGWGEMIAEVVRDRRMPPWHADPQHGKFANDRSMPETEKNLIYQWVQNGCPEGDPADLPEPRHFTDGWQLPREPDLVLAMDESFKVPADAGREGVPYQYFRVPTGFTEDKWISATEVRPGNRLVVHHVIVYVEPPGGRRRRDWTFLSAYVPGLRFDPLPAGSAKRIPANSKLVFEMHYTPNGSVQEDKTEIGLVFTETDPNDVIEVITCEIGNTDFEIPPHEANHVVTATSQPTTQDVTLISLSPHMHLRGKAFRYELFRPTGERETLLNVPAYDFNWQTRYRLAEPRKLPAGSVIYCRAVFDNSEKNLANPDPTKSVEWGEQSWEEMMLGFFDVVMPPGEKRKPGTKPVTTGLDFVGLFDTADADHNGGLSTAEAAGHELITQHFASIDQDDDELLQLGEILAAIKLMAATRR